MRVFIAIELPEAVKMKIAQVQERLKKTKDRIRWVEPSIIHLTLKFLGEISEKDLEKVKEAAEKAVKSFAPFSFEVEGVGAFPSSSSPRVIWMGVGEGKDVLTRLATQIEEELVRCGFGRDKRWIPHLTMGRVRSLEEREKLASLIQRERDAEAGKVRVEKVSIFKSRLTPKGPVYTVLKHILLKGGRG
ncbi:RNA 2',3'-cyclic phosphodiesterase [Candidatus Aerophobetes bacterium]|nr:RNA 2',3'-cyclic phosphodiesterase [Candidatus Aerophobetes bacterium]